MIERLEFTLNKYNELQEKLTNPDIVSNIEEVKKISKNISDLEDIVVEYKKYKDILTEIEDLKEMEKDPEMYEMAHEELENKTQEKENMESNLEILLLPKDENDDKNAIIQIRGAAGGDEANIFAGDLFRMYTKYVDKQGFKYEVFSSQETELGHFLSGPP